MPSLRKTALIISLLSQILCAKVETVSAEQECERLKNAVEYTQQEAPRGFGTMIKAVTDELNKVLDGVIGAEVEWNGSDLHGRVGERLIKCNVQRLAKMIPPEIRQGRQVFVNEMGQEVIEQCFQLPFTIYDTNECTLPMNHDMRHQCREPAICVNTMGSYECLCPRLDGFIPPHAQVYEDARSRTFSLDAATDQEPLVFEALWQEKRSPWEMAISTPSATTCPSLVSTRGCCPEMAHSRDGVDCRKQFLCPIDPCSETRSGNNSCAPGSQCVRREDPREDPNHSCICPDGLLGNGRTCGSTDAKPEPKVTFEGRPTDETVRNNYCGCTKPTVDACAGFPPCTNKHEICVVGLNDRPACGCKKGFVNHEQYGCVDERPPQMKLSEDPYNDQTLRLKQGDIYEEFGVRITDGNVEDYLRHLQILYSEATTQGCLTKAGEFYVNYTIKTPWTDPSSVSISRRVIIEDIDECSLDVAKYETTCPELIPRCDTDAGAKCINTVGSYTCECPKFTTGDGFRQDYAFLKEFEPAGYAGGTSCIDNTKPILELKGPNPKIFKICPCGGLSGIMQENAGGNDELREAQRAHYEYDIKELIKSTQGAELCAHAGNTRPRAANCVKAYDETHKGDVDLSARVTVGEPIKKSSLHWIVPYDVKDDAGNQATTIWRDVVIEEVDIEVMESKLREQAKLSKETEIQNAVAKALKEERNKVGNTHKGKNRDGTSQNCPACPKCGESSVSHNNDKDKLDIAACEKLCEHRAQQCSLHDESNAVAILVWLEQLLPHWAAVITVVIVGAICAWVALTTVAGAVFYLTSFGGNYDYVSDREREQTFRNSVTYYGEDQLPQQPQQPSQYPSQFGGSMDSKSPGGMQGGMRGGMQGGVAGGPPRRSRTIENQGSDFFLSPINSSGNGLFGSPQPIGMGINGNMNGNNGMEDPNDIYALPNPIYPSPRPGDREIRRRSPGVFSPGYSPGSFQ